MTKSNFFSQEIVEIGRLLHQKNFIASADGNISIRDGDKIWITPSGRHKGFLRPEDLAQIDLQGETLHGHPSSEKSMHLTIYQTCPQAKAVVHAHPPCATAWSIAFPDAREIPKDAMSELILAVGSIPISPYSRPGSEAMGEALKPYLPKNRVIILQRHGAIAWGESLWEAYCGIERLEHACQILLNAKILGQISKLPESEVAALLEMREQIGPKIL